MYVHDSHGRYPRGYHCRVANQYLYGAARYDTSYIAQHAQQIQLVCHVHFPMTYQGLRSQLVNVEKMFARVSVPRVRTRSFVAYVCTLIPYISSSVFTTSNPTVNHGLVQYTVACASVSVRQIEMWFWVVYMPRAADCVPSGLGVCLLE